MGAKTMRLKLAQTIGILSVLSIAAATAAAQSSLNKYPPPSNTDGAFVVYLEHPVVAGHHVLPPGSYTVYPMYVAGTDMPVLQIRGDHGSMDVDVPVARTFREIGPPENEVTFYRRGNNYYFRRIWVQGLNYGYKFRLPKSASRGK